MQKKVRKSKCGETLRLPRSPQVYCPQKYETAKKIVNPKIHTAATPTFSGREYSSSNFLPDEFAIFSAILIQTSSGLSPFIFFIFFFASF